MANLFSIGKLKNLKNFFNLAEKSKFRFFNVHSRVVDLSALGAQTCLQFDFAIIASKKHVAKLATRRNFVKRRLRAAIIQALQTLEQPYDTSKKIEIVFFSHRSILDCSYEELQQYVTKTIQKIMCKSSC